MIMGKKTRELHSITSEDVAPIAKPPKKFSLDKFKSKLASTIANVETLPGQLPIHNIAQANDYVRLHPDEELYWSPELCFVNVPIKGQKRDTLHLIDEDLATLYLPSKKILRFRLALATKPHDVLFLCRVPTQNLDNSFNAANLQACEVAKTSWVEVTSRKEEGVDSYKINWLINIGVVAWPRLESGQLDISGDAFRLMYHIPGIDELHALRDSLGVIVRAKLPIGRDGRNRPSLFPFCTATGRNAHAKSLFNAHASMRSFMVFPEDTIGIYLDWRTQEVGVAAARSGDEQLKADYLGGDVYYGLGELCGQTFGLDQKQWKKSHTNVRQRMKSLQLGINYGMCVPSLAKGLDRHPLIASIIIELHKQKYATYWKWRANMVQQAMLDRKVETVFGWPLHISNSPNKRTLYNFPMQGDGAEMLRLAAWRLCETGIVPNMLIHDGILLEVRSEEEIAAAIEIMKSTGRDVCNGLEIGVDIDQKLERGARYRDKREVAQKMWDTIMLTLEEIGALPRDHELRRSAR
jgi:hypothetical protein